MPKQLLPLIDGKSLLRLSFERSLALAPPERIVVVTGEAHAAAVRDQLPELPASNVLGEPTGRDSLNAVAWAAAVLHASDPDAVIAHVTADHLIEPVETFTEVIQTAFGLVDADPMALVTLGVVPTSPHTGYGYLHRGAEVPGFPGAHQVVEFAEKPALEVAERYLASGEYWWNAGMFIWRADTLLEQLKLLLPDTYASVLALADQPDRLAEIFPTLMKTSVDYAVMEPVSVGRGTARVLAVALPVSWRDVGGFSSLAEVLAHDADENAVSGTVVTRAASRNVVMNTDDGSLVALLGVADLVVVRTPEITVVTDRDHAEQIKDLVADTVAALGDRFA